MRTFCKLAVPIIVTLVFSASILSSVKVCAAAGPRSDLDVTFYASDSTAWTALVNGQADMLQWALTETQREQAELDPNLQLARFDEPDMFEFDLNSNYSIKSYPGVRSATNELKVRQAIARLIDKDYIVAHFLNGFGVRIDQPMSAPQTKGWANSSCIGSHYQYQYDPQAAADLLAEAGFADTDYNGWLNYPADWPGAPGADTTQYPLVTCVRIDQSYRLASGQYLLNQLEITLASTSIGAGFKTTGIQWHRDRAILGPKVMGNRDYNIYTGSWSLGRYPTYLFYLFNSEFWYSYGTNYITGMNENNEPNYPDVNAVTEAIWNPENDTDARRAAQRFCYLHSEYCITIALWSSSSYWAYRKELAGIINMDGFGYENSYTFLNAYRQGNGPLRYAAVQGPDGLNILYSSWLSEYAFLGRVYESCLNVQPYDVSVDQPWVIQDWNIGTWDDGGVEKSMCTYYIRKQVGIVAPVTGTYLRDWNASDFEFTVWYNYASDDSWQWWSFMDIRYTKVVDLNGDGWNEFQIYFDGKSYWSYSAPTFPLLTWNELLDPLNAQTTESWAQAGTTQHNVAQNVVKVVSCALDGAPLVEGTDYIIRGGYDMTAHSGFVPLHAMVGTISMTYWYADIPATGFYLAGLPWQQTMYSIGSHYPASMTHDPPSAGDTIGLARNEHFLIGEPILGEIDWAWKFSGAAAPRSGNYKIDIFDLTRATAAYCTRGDFTYDSGFFNGADLDSTDLCHIGIYDLVTITSVYGKAFGEPLV